MNITITQLQSNRYKTRTINLAIVRYRSPHLISCWLHDNCWRHLTLWSCCISSNRWSKRSSLAAYSWLAIGVIAVRAASLTVILSPLIASSTYPRRCQKAVDEPRARERRVSSRLTAVAGSGVGGLGMLSVNGLAKSSPRRGRDDGIRPSSMK